MSYKIAIPSHRRSDLIEKSLRVLEGIDRNLIHVFVSDEVDWKEYKRKFPDLKIIWERDLEDLKEKHNFMVDWFSEGEKIVFMEDDIEKVLRKKGNKTEEFKDIQKLFHLGFAECLKEGVKMWGIEPTGNGFYMKTTYKKTKKLVAAYLYGMIIDKRIRITSAWKHDFERTIQMNIIFGGSIRFDMFSVKTNSFGNKGGLLNDIDKETRAQRELEGAEYLVKKYPGWIDFKIRKNKSFASCRQIDCRIISK